MMRLNNVTLLNSHLPVTISVSNEYIVPAGQQTIKAENDFELNFTDAIAFPGLINSHDHLDFNCFSPLGNQTYANYTEWGRHIHEAYKNDINAVLKIPQPLRTAWGVYKNLLAGVTTVINHGEKLPIAQPLITVCQDMQNLHSVQFEPKWKWKLNNPFQLNKVCVMHAGEGVDTPSSEEISELLKWNLLGRKLVGVHAVAMNPQQASKFLAVVWCPQTNQLLLNKHAAADQLKQHTRVVFGTDSTLTGNWNIWQHLQLARYQQLVTDAELFDMVTGSAAALWQINTGALQPGRLADIVIAKTPSGNAEWNDIFSIDPTAILMVVHKGAIRLFDESLLPQLRRKPVNLQNYSAVQVQGVRKFVEGDLPGLIQSIKAYCPTVHLPIDIVAMHKN